MNIIPVKTPKLVKHVLPSLVWNIETTEKIIYLTFDDGPTPKITNWTLDILKQHNAKATFFCIGNNIEKHPEIFQGILKDGHAIGNHTQNHIRGWKTKAKDYLNNIGEAQETINFQIPQSKFQDFKITNLFRPPYGQITPKQGRKLINLGYKIVMWDVLSFDWDHTIEKENCLENVLAKTSRGSIIVFHDSVKASKNMQYALPKVLAHFSEKGYCFKALNSTV